MKLIRIVKLIMGISLLFIPVFLLASKPPLQASANLIYINGNVLTMNDAQLTAQAVAVKDNTILAVGTNKEILSYKTSQTEVIDLQGKTLLPGFIDAHSHINQVAVSLGSVDLTAPPIGNVKSISDLQRKLENYILTHKIPKGSWIIGYGFDNDAYPNQTMPTKADLDKISTQYPIIIVHISLHAGVVNSLGLEKLQATELHSNLPSTENDQLTKNGLLQEGVFFKAFDSVSGGNLQEELINFQKAQELYIKNGITTAQDGASLSNDYHVVQQADQKHLLKIDIISYPLWPQTDQIWTQYQKDFHDSRFQLGGVKIILDGSPQAFTAYLAEPYLQPPANFMKPYLGAPAFSQDTLNKLIIKYCQEGKPINTHVNGDGAIQMLIEAVKNADKNCNIKNKVQFVAMHSQTVREDQLTTMKNLAIFPSFFPAHTYYWGDKYVSEILGEPRASHISPLASAKKLGLTYSIHTDSPVVPINHMALLWSAVNRITRSGAVLGPEERIEPYIALQAMTINVAKQYQQEKIKGSIEPGKYADLIILSENPLTINPMQLKDIKVLATYSRGKALYCAPGNKKFCPKSIEYQ